VNVLTPIEETSLSCLNLIQKALEQVFVDDIIRGSEESEDMGDEGTFVVVHAVIPVVEILRKVHLLSCPERCLGFLVHLPNPRTGLSIDAT